MTSPARLACIYKESLQDGLGCNLVVVFQGCSIGCPGCHNQELWPKEGGRDWTIEEVFSHVTAVTTGVTLSGGEPTEQPEAAVALLKEAKRRGLQTTMYTGLDLLDFSALTHATEILSNLDYIKMGPYNDSKRVTTAGLYGSTNQRFYAVVEEGPGQIVLNQIRK